MKKILTAALLLFAATMAQAKTLIVYYSYTNTCKTTAEYLSTKISGADLLAVTPAEILCYDCNNYAIGMQELNDINANPDSESAYPAITTTIDNLADYSAVVIVTPLWWSQMAAPMQTFLFKYGSQMAGKSIFMIVASASSGISGVVSRAKKLIPNGNFVTPSLHIYSSDVRGTSYRTKVDQWLKDTDYQTTGITGLLKPGLLKADITYNLVGQSVDKPRHGIYIRNGVKVAVR